MVCIILKASSLSEVQSERICMVEEENFHNDGFNLKIKLHLPSSAPRQCKSKARIFIHRHTYSDDSESLWCNDLTSYHRHSTAIINGNNLNSFSLDCTISIIMIQEKRSIDSNAKKKFLVAFDTSFFHKNRDDKINFFFSYNFFIQEGKK